MGNRFGQLVNTKSSGGLSVAQFWARVLEVNEMYWERYPDYALTDEGIQALVFKAFPDRAWSKGLGSVVRYRSSYNRGGLTDGAKPKSPSFRYTRESGHIVRWEPGKSRVRWSVKASGDLSGRVQVSDIVAGILPKI